MNKTRNNRGTGARYNNKGNNNRLSVGLKYFSVILAISAVVLLGAQFKSLLIDVNKLKIKHVVVEGTLDFVSRVELEQTVLSFIDQGLIGIELDNIKVEIEKNAWVKSVEIERKWPDTMILSVEEQVAIARWGNDQLLNQEGDIFSPNEFTVNVDLPYLYGPINTQQTVMEQYQQINQLLYSKGLRIANLGFNERGAWTLNLENGTEIKVGKNNVLNKIRRLLGVIDYLLLEEMIGIESIDLRYTNGIAVNRRTINEEMVLL